jgi:hypothetical protein
MSRESILHGARGLVLVLLAATPGEARGEMNATVRQQLIEAREHALAEGKSLPASAPSVQPKFGIDDGEIINVHAYAFQANTSSDLILDDGNGYRYFGASGIPYMAASVQIPPGAELNYLAISACSVNRDLVVGLFDNGVEGSGSGGGTLLESVTTFAGCNVSSSITAPGFAHYTAAVDHPLYLVVFFAGNAFDGTTKFNNVAIGFRRTVSEAPATATFNDVPTSDPAFQYIEALVASGITAGCAGGNYCPDNFVTRRQMAVFLSKALGLHWPF